jgi:chaperonin cofactor prefoldin
MKSVLLFMMFIASSVVADQTDVAVQEFEKEAKNRPVSKVIGLLEDMVKQLEKEGEEDEEVYETMGCWCVTNEKSKTKSIADAETDIETLAASIESLTAQSAKLNTEISKLESEIKENNEALATATEVREKELAEFTQMEKDSLVSISQLKNAVIALSKAHEEALLKQKSKVGKVDAKKLDATDSGLNPDFVKEIEKEALRAHMHRIIKTHPAEVVTAFVQVNHKEFAPIQRQEITAFLQDSSNHDFDDLPDHLLAQNSNKAQPIDEFLQSSNAQAAPLHYADHKNFASKIRDFALNIQADKEDLSLKGLKALPRHSFTMPEMPPAIQSLLTKVMKGVDTGLLESSMDDSEMGNTKYEPASGAIFGVLKQMKENMETNLKQSQQEEAKASDEYDQMKAAKETEIKTSTDLVDSKRQELAKTDEKNAEDKEIKEDTETSLAADQAFLADLKERCASMDAEFEERTKGRQLEIEAVSKALAFLNSDEAHDLFTRTFNPVLVQVNAQSQRTQRRLAVAKLLRTAAVKANDPRLLSVASKVNKAGDNAAFDKVKEEVIEMIDKLKKEQKDEMKKRDYCIDALNTNERDQGMKTRDKEDLIALIDDLKMTIGTLDKEIEVLKAEIAELEIQMKRAKENREKENGEFEVTVADQRATQKLLAVSLKILSDFYGFVQVRSDQKEGQKTVAGQAPPPGFRKYEKSASSGGVMGMMQGIIDDAKAMEAECIRAEEKAQKDYEDFVKDSQNSIDTKTNDIETKSEDLAKAESDKVQAEKDLEATITELESLANEEADLHKECDFLMKNFDQSQAARSAEIESLKEANQIFSGASYKLFLQQYAGWNN